LLANTYTAAERKKVYPAISSIFLHPEQEKDDSDWSSVIKVINNSAMISVEFVPSRLLLDLQGTNSVIGRSLESESESEEEEIYSMSSILMDVGLRRGDGARTADASRRSRVVNVERSSALVLVLKMTST
jgi:hypothetical protein